MKPPRVDDSQPWIGVCITPQLIDQFDLSDSIVVVIDILRATTSMAVAFHFGARSMIPVASLDEARALKDQGFLAAAERNGEQIEGFHFGNSPFSYMNQDIEGKDIVISTTNGTQAIKAAVEHKASEIVIGAFSNLSILSNYLVERNKNVVMLCAGWKMKPNLEDTIFAGAMVRKLKGQFRRLQDSALIAETLYRNANRRKRYFIRNSSHFNRLFHILQIQKDVKYALRPDTHPVIPKLYGDRLISMHNPFAEEYTRQLDLSESV